LRLAPFYDGATHLVQFNATNGAAATLNINSLGAKPLYTYQSAGWAAAPAGVLTTDMIAPVVYDSASGAYRVLKVEGGWNMDAHRCQRCWPDVLQCERQIPSHWQHGLRLLPADLSEHGERGRRINRWLAGRSPESDLRAYPRSRPIQRRGNAPIHRARTGCLDGQFRGKCRQRQHEQRVPDLSSVLIRMLRHGLCG
jgi:hypothetical protein